MKILILRVSAIGDVIHTLPSISLIKNIYPDAKISWVVQKKAANLLENQPFLENLWILPDKFLLPKNWGKTIKILRQIRKTKWDVILDFQGIPKTSILSLLLKGQKFGFDCKNARSGVTSFLNHVKIKPDYTNIIQKNLALTSGMLWHKFKIQSCPTVKNLQKNFNLEIRENSKNVVEKWLTENAIKKFITLIPNTTWESKHWPQENWKKLIELLRNDFDFSQNYSVILIGKEFGEQAKNIANFISEQKLDVKITPKWDLITTAALISRSNLSIAPDTGLLHLADFLGKKTIGIFGPTQIKKHGPFLTTENIQAVIQIECSHYYEKKHGKIRHNSQKSSILNNCMYKLTPESLFKKILKSLN